MESPSRPLHLRVIPLQECNTEDPGLQRLLSGPIDIYDGKGYDPDLISNFLNDYYLLFHDDTCVGFCSIYTEGATTVLNEFEIYHEHRGSSYGSIFAKHLIYKFIKTEKVEIYEIMSNAFLFWWRCLGGTYFVKHIADVIGARSAKNLGAFEEWTIKNKHKYQQNTYQGFSYVAKFLVEFPDASDEEVAAMVEATSWYQVLFQNRIPTPPRPPTQTQQPAVRPGTPFPRLMAQSGESSLFPSLLL